MIKIFVTGDNHFGKKYGRYPEIKDKLIQSRFDVLEDMVQKAEMEGCELFVITGDLFDNIKTIKVSDVKHVAGILAGFTGNVIVLPGNHDYFTGDETVWKDFENAISSTEHNITLIKEYRKYEFDTAEEKIAVYPAFCRSKHSKENNLGWIKSEEIHRDGAINIGIAHGALRGITPDLKEEYFLMTEMELSAIPVDVWLIGHTHIPYPDTLEENSDAKGYKIFNAGTHEQTDLSNNTEGNCFILTIRKQGESAEVLARKYVSGKIRFYDLDISVKPDRENSLSNAIKEAVKDKDMNSVLRLNLSGSLKQEEYRDRSSIYRELLGGFLTYEINDSDLNEEITIEKIHEEFAETSFAAQFMEELIDNPTELQMAYQLLQECRES